MTTESLSINDLPDWPEILQAHRRWLESVVYARLRDRHAVDEVLQETALAASRRLQPAADHAGTCRWLYRVAIRQAMLHRRRAIRHQDKLSAAAVNGAVPDSAVETNPYLILVASEQRAGVRAALQQLAPRDYQVLMLKYADGWSCREMAERLGVSESAMKSRLLRARNSLRTELLKQNRNWDLS